MTTVPIELYRALHKAVVPEQEAEGAARSVWDSSHLATQEDFSTLSNKIVEVKSEIAEIKVEMAEVKSERAEIKGDMGEVKGELKLIKCVLALIVVVLVMPLLRSWLEA